MTVRYYSSVAFEKQLVGTITSGATTCVVSDTVGLPVLFPYTLALSYETLTEELVEVTNAAGTTLTITRAIDGTSAVSHAAGARVRHTSSARDFADSRNHENADDGIHGLAPGEEIVGTDKVQTLTNKTVVNLQGTLQNPDINMTGANIITIAKAPAGVGTDAMLEVVNGSDQTLAIQNNGAVKVRNTLAMDSATGTRRVTVVMSDGTTERFYVDTTGQIVSLPRTGTAAANGGLKVVEPGDITLRKAIQIRNSTDTADRFVAYAGGFVSIASVDPAQTTLYVQGAAAQAAPYLQVLNSTATVQVQVDQNGQVEARKKLFVTNDTLPGDIVSTVRGTALQTGNLQQWQDNSGAAVARVTATGASDFTPVITTDASVFTAAAGWSLTSAVAVAKAGIVTINLSVLRTGATIVAGAGGDLFGDPPLGTIAAALRPHTAFAPSVLCGTVSNGLGSGSWFLNPTFGDITLQTWSTNNEILSGINVRVTMTYPLAFV